MRHKLLSVLLAASSLAVPTLANADGAPSPASNANANNGYFGDGSEQLTFKEPGSRSHKQNVVLLTLVGATVLTGAVGTYYLLDSQSQSDKVSASGMHTLETWDASHEQTRQDALHSGSVAKVTLGISGGLALATLVTYIVTHPNDEVGYQDWQTRHRVPTVAPVAGGAIVAQGWTF